MNPTQPAPTQPQDGLPTPVEASNRRSRRATNRERARTSPVRLLVITLGAVVVGVGLMTGAFIALGERPLELVAPAADETDPMGGALDDPAVPDEADVDDGRATDKAAEGDLADPVALRDFDLEPTRDPFSEVIPATTATAGTEGDTTAPAAGTGDGETVPDAGNDEDDSDGSAEPTPTGTGCVEDDDVVCDGYLVSLLEVLRRADGHTVAIVQIDTTVYEAAAGTRLTDRFEVRSIDGGCATLRFDDVEDFTVCAGERVLK